MNELARLLGLDKSSVSGLVDRAQRRGLVVRRRSTEDGRAVIVGLTRAGRSLVAEVAAGFEQEVETLLEPLQTTERATLTSLATRVLVAHASAGGIYLFPTTDPGAET